jgi:alkaline phosphatase D
MGRRSVSKFGLLFMLLGVLVFIGMPERAEQDLERLDFDERLRPFYHGVASGDPTNHSVIIWTRVTTALPSVAVQWRMALDPAMTHIVQKGTTKTDAQSDFTVKVDVEGLAPNTYYYYDFAAEGGHSIVGRTKTAPLGNINQLRFGVFSCASFGHGYFNAYRHQVQQNDVDAILHLGDYIYEYGIGEYGQLRAIAPNKETVTLSDYRTRYSFYRLDPDLRAIHQQYPFFSIWDDHESADDAWAEGADNHDQSEGDWIARKGASQQAYLEWMPVRDRSGSIYRKVKYGSLAEIFFLDTRLEGRSDQLSADNAYKTMLGSTQYNWLISGLKNSTAKWKIIAQQVMVAPLDLLGMKVNIDQWDSYSAERGELLHYIYQNNIQNVVVLTGDIHSSWANDLPLPGYSDGDGWFDDQPCENTAAVEFVTTSVTSPGLHNLGGLSKLLTHVSNPHVQFADLQHRGYMIIDITRPEVHAEWRLLKTIQKRDLTLRNVRQYVVFDRFPCVERAIHPTRAPAYIDQPMAREGIRTQFANTVSPHDAILSKPPPMHNRYDLYPNPTRNRTQLSFFAPQAFCGKLSIIRGDGQPLIQREVLIHTGYNLLPIDLQMLPSDVYSIVLSDEQGRPLNNNFVLKMDETSK